MDIIESHVASSRKATNCMEVLLDNWGTMGVQRRPTVRDLLKHCVEANQLTAASYISDEILKEGPITIDNCKEIALANDSGAPALQLEALDINAIDIELESDLELATDNSDFLPPNQIPVIPENALSAHRIEFRYLQYITDDFSHKIGEGGFSEVFLGVTKRRKIKVAIKKLKKGATYDEREKLQSQLNYEVDQYCRLQHPNIIELLGYSNDNPDNLCLLYPYMVNGTLKEKLEMKDPQLNAGTSMSSLHIFEKIADVCLHF